MPRTKQWIVYLGAGCSLLFLYLALRHADPTKIFPAFSDYRWGLALPLLGSYTLFFLLKTRRWSLMLHAIKPLNTRDVWPSMVVGSMANNVLPAHIGEFVRVYILADQFQVEKLPVFATIGLERIMDFVAVMMLLGAALLSLGHGSPVYLTAGLVIGLGSLCLLMFCVIFALKTRAILTGIEPMMRLMPTRWRDKLMTHFETVAAGLGALQQPHRLAGMLALTFAQWLCVAVSIGCGLAAAGAHVPPAVALIVLGYTVLGITLPTAPGFFGTVQLCFALALQPFGVTSETAFAASVFYHLLTYLAVTLAGLYFLRHLGYTLRALKAASDKQTPDGSQG